MLAASFRSSAQDSVLHRYIQIKKDPIFFIDSINVTRISIANYKPNDIASVSVYKDTNAIRLIGPQGSAGVVFIETKSFARSRYWKFFKGKSAEYYKALPNPESDSTVVYILNGKVLQENFEGNLSGINDNTFIDLTVIDKDRLKKDFDIDDKKYGILIKTQVKEK